ncbi:MAG TPA: type I-E CRISPR-associated protein Cas7/Cse4/CasC [Caldilineaceae bacterium]|nr:type I-E CRISPR-associated protein Cas7/Cse4/CasC [Caldilineaceae bacterium]
MFVELHLLQSFGPSNLNRDDTNSPKDCEFGGHRRARISSQALKRAIRKEPKFAELTQAEPGQRSKWLTRPLVKQLVEAGKAENQAREIAVAFTTAYAGKMDAKNPEKTSVLLFYSPSEVELIVSNLLAQWDSLVEAKEKARAKLLDGLVKEIIKATKERTSAPDIALFGRMLADKPELNIDAACQVAHAISTHRVQMEMDYYTAVDELLQDEEAGAGMVGFTGFNSACFYRYARIDFDQLRKNLDNDVALAQRTVLAFVRAALNAIPTGKQNAFAAQSPTDLALAVARSDGMSWSLVNAFETPVRPGHDSGYLQPSIAALDAYWAALTSFYDDAQINAVAVHVKQHADTLNALKPYRQDRLSNWLATISSALPKE